MSTKSSDLEFQVKEGTCMLTSSLVGICAVVGLGAWGGYVGFYAGLFHEVGNSSD